MSIELGFLNITFKVLLFIRMMIIIVIDRFSKFIKETEKYCVGLWGLLYVGIYCIYCFIDQDFVIRKNSQLS